MKDINLFETRNSIFLKKISSKSEVIDGPHQGYLIDSSESEARRIIEKLKNSKKIIAILGKDDKFNRRAIETLKINYLVSPERLEKYDTLKQRNSGLNHVTAKEATNKNISMVIDMSQISKLSVKEKSLRLQKIIQNIKICKKQNCKIKIASLASKKQGVIDQKARSSIGLSLGMSTTQSKDSTDF